MSSSIPRRLARLSRLPFALLACAPGMAAADSPDLSTLPLEDLMQMRVVTSASKFAQPISDAPSPVVVLTAADIRDFGWRTLADALATLPGLYVANDRNYAYLGARGFLRPGDYNSRFLLMIDGVRTNDAVYDQALIGTEGLLDMDMVKRIEFVPGPGSAVYGANALFGVINVITRDGAGLPGAQGAFAAGSQGERKARASIGWHGRNGADLLLSATRFERAGQDLYFREFDTPDQNNGVAHGLDYDRARHLLVKGGYRGLAFSASYVDRTKGVPTGAFDAVFGAPNRTRDSQAMAALSWNGQLAPQAALSARLSWGRADYLGTGWYPDDDGGAQLNIDGAHARWHEASVQATLTGLADHKIVVGAEAGRDARRNQFSYDAGAADSLLDDRRSAGYGALFVEDEIRLPAGFIVNAGARFDRRTGPDTRRTTPRIAVLYRPNPVDTFKLIYGSAFRSPNAYEMYYTLPGPGGQQGKPDLRSERIVTREAVFEHALANAGHATLSLFQYAVEGLIDQYADPGTGLLVFRNLARADVKGLEAALDRPFGAARLRASYAWQLARDAAGTPLAASPRHLAKLNLLTPLADGRASLGTEMLCSAGQIGERESDGSRYTTGGWCVTNLTLGLPRLAPDADLSLSLYNALDQRHADVTGPAFRQDAIARQGRTFYAKMVYRF